MNYTITLFYIQVEQRVWVFTKVYFLELGKEQTIVLVVLCTKKLIPQFGNFTTSAWSESSCWISWVFKNYIQESTYIFIWDIYKAFTNLFRWIWLVMWGYNCQISVFLLSWPIFMPNRKLYKLCVQFMSLKNIIGTHSFEDMFDLITSVGRHIDYL